MGIHLTPVRLALAFALFVAIAPAGADGDDPPPFDRPGIAFSTSVFKPGQFDLEQGLPDYSRDSADGVRTRVTGGGSRVRVGLHGPVEAQVFTSIINHQDVDDHGDRSHVDGTGDSGVALKVQLPIDSDAFSAATLLGATFASGAPAFSAGHPVLSLGVTGNAALNDTVTLGAFADVDRSARRNTYTVSPDCNVKLGQRWSAYVEGGRSFGNGVSETRAGAGLAFLLTHRIQLDASFLRGITRASTDLQAGFGISAAFN